MTITFDKIQALALTCMPVHWLHTGHMMQFHLIILKSPMDLPFQENTMEYQSGAL
jgi:hypothetical protein